MNVFDVLVVLLTAAAAFGGYRLGLIARGLSWIGMLIGIFLMARLLPVLVVLVAGPGATGRLVVASGFLLGGAFAGQALGLAVGARANLALPVASRGFDRVAGSVAGGTGLLVALWLLLPTIAQVPGTVARQARTSTLARVIDAATPTPPDAVQTLRGLVGEGGFPQVFPNLTPAPDVGPPPFESGLDQATLDRVVASSLRIEGPACGRNQEGSGFVVEPGVVVTNAHVVAGHDRTEVVDSEGTRREGEVVYFDPDTDLALVNVVDLDAPPLSIFEADVGTMGAVLGYPAGGGLRVAPFEVRDEVRAMGRDLYDSQATERQVLVLATELGPGDSGGALVDASGSVVGVAFAIAPDRPGVAYALSTDELSEALAAPRSSATETGPCVAG